MKLSLLTKLTYAFCSVIIGKQLYNNFHKLKLQPIASVCSFSPFTSNSISAPLLCMYTVPFMGKCSDDIGQRRPFIFGLAMLGLMSLSTLSLSQWLYSSSATFTYGMILMAMSVIALDYSNQVCFSLSF